MTGANLSIGNLGMCLRVQLLSGGTANVFIFAGYWGASAVIPRGRKMVSPSLVRSE